MKNSWKGVMLACVVAFTTACSEDEPEPAINSDEAAELIGASLSANAGLATVVSQSAIAANAAVEASSSGRQQACSFSDEDHIELASDPGSAITFNYVFDYAFQLVCEGESPASLTAEVSYDLDYDGPNVGFEFTGTSALSVSNLQESSTFLINGDFDRTGSYEWKQNNPGSGTSTVDISLDDLEVTKETHLITGGTATVDLSGSVAGKGSYSYSATVTFNSDGTANLTVNGAAYVVNVQTGTVNRG